MDPLLQEVVQALGAVNAQGAGAMNLLQNTVAAYENMNGPLPDDIASQVLAMNSLYASVPGVASVTMANLTPPVGAPPAVSSSGLRLGSIVIPWAGVAAIVLFVGAAWYFSKRRR